MADTTTIADPGTVAGKVLDALADVLKSSSTSASQEAQALLLKRLATEGDVFPSRVPAPRNITEIGGYLNLLEQLNQQVMRTQALGAILGVAGPNPIAGSEPAGFILYDVTRANDRPAGAAQPTYTTQFSVRNDFAAALDAALTTIHAAGCSLPILMPPTALPLAGPMAPKPTDLLRYLGRTLDLAPAAALTDPDADPLALARLQGGAPAAEVVARQIDATAANAASVVKQKWIAWKCDANACAETAAADRFYLPLTPILNAAGWYQAAPTAPTKLSAPDSWGRWSNISGLVAHSSRYRDELALRYQPETIAASSLRDVQDYMWDGKDFVAPA